MQKVRLEISGIAYSQTQSGSYVLTLSETSGSRKLPIVIGGFEAQAIAVELEKMIPNRPLTHDLIKSFCVSFDVVIKEVLIYKFVEGVFYAKLICERDGVLTEIDSRTSDAIAIAIRYGCPIFTYEDILSRAGIIISSSNENKARDAEHLNLEEEEDKMAEPQGLNTYSLARLKKMLNKVIEAEDYEKASEIRDEINKRKGK